MTQPSYTNDLTDLTDAESAGTWLEMGSPYNAGGAPGESTDYFIQGTGCAVQAMSASKSGLLFSMCFDAGSGQEGSFATDDCVFMWQNFGMGNAVEIYANGGLRLVIGSNGSIDNAGVWITGGRDFGRNPYGGWQNVVVDPTLAVDYTIGSGNGGSWRYFGSMPYTIATISKGEVHGIDAIRYGRGELIIEYGDVTNGYCTFGELANANDANDVSFTADTTNTDATLTNIAAAEVELLYPGAPLSGTGIPASTYVQSIVSTTSIEMTNTAKATGSGVSITSQPYNR